MDKSVNPCDDFYTFSCGGFMKNNFIPDESDQVSLFTINEKKIKDEIADILDTSGYAVKPVITAVDKMFTFYASCIDSEYTNDNSEIVKFMRYNFLIFSESWPLELILSHVLLKYELVSRRDIESYLGKIW